MKADVLYCPVCDGIEISWNMYTQKWTAVYVDCGIYCSCSDKERSERFGTYLPELARLGGWDESRNTEI